MQNMHKSTVDRPLTGVHWPIHRFRGSGTKDGLSNVETGKMSAVAMSKPVLEVATIG